MGCLCGHPNPLRVQRFDAAKSLQGTVVNPELGRLLLLMPVRFSDGGRRRTPVSRTGRG